VGIAAGAGLLVLVLVVAILLVRRAKNRSAPAEPLHTTRGVANSLYDSLSMAPEHQETSVRAMSNSHYEYTQSPFGTSSFGPAFSSSTRSSTALIEVKRNPLYSEENNVDENGVSYEALSGNEGIYQYQPRNAWDGPADGLYADPAAEAGDPSKGEYFQLPAAPIAQEPAIQYDTPRFGGPRESEPLYALLPGTCAATGVEDGEYTDPSRLRPKTEEFGFKEEDGSGSSENGYLSVCAESDPSQASDCGSNDGRG